MSENKFFSFLKKYWWWLLLTATLIILHGSHTFNSDEGIILNGAWNILQGKVLYKDFFEMYSPGSFYLLAGWWKVFSPTFFWAKTLSLLIVLLGSLGIYQITRQLHIKKWSWLPPLLFILLTSFTQTINHNLFSLVCLIWVVVLFFYSMQNDYNPRKLFYIGLLSGLTAIFLQHRGAVIIFTIIMMSIILILKKNITLKLVAYFGIGVITPCLFLCIFWSPSLLFSNLIIFPFFNYTHVNMVPLNLWWAIGLCEGLLFFITFFYYKNDFNKNVLIFLGIIQATLWLSVIQRADIDHLSQTLFPVTLWTALLFEKNINKPIERISITSLIIMLTLISTYFLRTKPLFGVGEKNIIEPLQKNISLYCPGPSFYSGPFAPSLYFEFKKNNISPYSFLVTGLSTEEQFSETAHLLESSPPSCVFLNYDLVRKFGYTKDNPVDFFLAEHYYLWQKTGNDQGLYRLK